MSLPKLPSSSSPPQLHLKHRVITCLNKLSDRDTLSLAATELESIARTLHPDSFSPFLTYLSTTSSSDKSPVRKQCVRLLGLLSAAHGDALSPHLSKMLSAILRRLRDSDSAVRAACVDAVSSMAAQITKPPFSLFVKPFVDAILHEQDYNSQIGSGMCLAGAIEAAPDPDPVQLQKLVPRLLKLVKSDCFKAKPALLSVIRSIVGAGGASNLNVLNCLVPCLVEFLSSEDWAARKAAAEALGRLAVAERNILKEFKFTCSASLESRRFDKVKVVRETMNRALELWKEVPGVAEEVLPQSQSLKDSGTGRYSPIVSEGPQDMCLETPQSKKTIPTNRSPPSNSSSAAATQKSSPNSHRKPSDAMFRKVDFKKPLDWKIEIAVPQPPSSNVACGDNFRTKNFGVLDSAESGSCSNLKLETKHVLFNRTRDEQSHKFGGLRLGARVVPFHENDNYQLDVADINSTDDVYGNYKEVEDLSLIQKQLLQIENQQSSLLDLLQRFIGSSQSGINSLETRVNGLEKALDEISYDLGISTGRISNTNTAGNSCCMLPGAEFLSPKFWRRTEGHYSTSRFSFPGRNQSMTAMCDTPDKYANAKMLKLDSPRERQQSGVGSIVNPLRGTHRDSRGSFESSFKTPKKIIQDAEMVQVCSAGGLDGGFFAKPIHQQT